MNPKESLIKGFKAAEKNFLEFAELMPNGGHYRFGSCALTALVVGKRKFIGLKKLNSSRQGICVM